MTNGFTLIEGLVTLAVAGILYAIAWPSFATLLADQRRIATVNDLAASFHHARHASIMQARPVSVCAGVDCGDDWNAGWIAFVEPAGWVPGDAVPEDRVLYHGAPAEGVAVSANRARFRFRAHGRATNGTLVVCAAHPASAPRVLVVAPTGRVRSGPTDRSRC